MSTQDLLGKLEHHRASTQQLHADLKNHVKGDAEKLAEAERLTEKHAATTDQFHNDAQVLVRPTDQPGGGAKKDPNVLVRPTTNPVGGSR